MAIVAWRVGWGSQNCQLESACVVCLEVGRDVVVEPCGHLVLCGKCLSQVERCPICRGDIVSASPLGAFLGR